jgi:hypothetical protein
VTTPDITDVAKPRRGPSPRPRAAAPPRSPSPHKTAGELCVDDIGIRVAFNWRFPHSNVHAHVAGELRQIAHDGNTTAINLTDTASNGDLEEFVLEHDTRIEVMAK